jgi:hypothetical protein
VRAAALGCRQRLEWHLRNREAKTILRIVDEQAAAVIPRFNERQHPQITTVIVLKLVSLRFRRSSFCIRHDRAPPGGTCCPRGPLSRLIEHRSVVLWSD